MSKKPAKTSKTDAAKPAGKKGSRLPRILVLEGAGGSAMSAVTLSGAKPIRVSPYQTEKIDEVLAAGRFDALLLTGGGDLDPRLYGEKPHKQVYGVSETRDYNEWMALDRARELGVPVMGICRGMQLIAVHNGGALKQHIQGHRGGSHLVFGESGSKFNRAIGHDKGSFPSLHHQVVRRTGGNGLKVAARSKEGYIEAIESPRVLATQFHPEYDYHSNEASRKLFDWLAAAAARKARVRKPKRREVPKPKPYQPTRGLAKRQYAQSEFEEHFNQQLALRAERLGYTVDRRGSVTPLPAPRPRREPVNSRWVCRDCGLLFDEKQDRDDHEVWVCGTPEEVAVIGKGQRHPEPPEGHPDWEPTRKRNARRS